MVVTIQYLNNLIMLIFLYNFIPFAKSIPQIFTDSYSFCEFKFNNRLTISFPNKVYTINKRDFAINFSICQSVHNKCANRTSSCLIHNGRNEMIDLGHEFLLGDSDDLNLVSVNGDRCPSNPSRNYTISIFLQCSKSVNPILMASDDEDECTYEISMMNPECTPKCTEMIQGAYLLDIRKFPKNIQVESDSKKFSLSLCSSNRICSQDVTACEILDNRVVPLANLESQHLSYDINKNELTARGRYKEGRTVRDLQVLIKCNWSSDMINPRYKKIPMQGKHYKFEVESTYGCVKLPHKCAFSSTDYLNYNLTSLYKEGGWQVSGVPQGSIFLNICGPLKQSKNLCSDQYSQVCHHVNGSHINRGSILTSLKAHDDVIKAIFESGSTCQENTTFLYSTEIEFSCSNSEKGPIFNDIKECIMYVSWETPRACPIDYYTDQNCYMNDRVSNRNLKELYTQDDRIYPLSSNEKTKLVYNLCGPIHSTCNNFTNVSFCLQTEENKETVIGWDKRELISDNGFLRMELDGASCLNERSKGEIIINFICNYEKPSPPLEINVIEDGCKFNMTIFTPLACLSRKSFEECVYSTDNLTYNLSPLVQKRRNYIVPVGDVEYIFNLCGPIVSGPGVLCRGDTMFCLHNKSEVSLKYRYTSLGGVAKPTLFNNSLVVESETGAYCAGLGYYKSVIHFECSERGYSPEFLSQDKCIFNFQWKTPEACAQEKKCIVPSSKPDLTLDLTRLKEKFVDVSIDNKTIYEFHLCKDVYTTKNSSVSDPKNTFNLKREYFHFDHNSYLTLDLEEKDCDNNSEISKVILKLECLQTIDNYFEQTSFQNCILNMTLKSSILCPTNYGKFHYSLMEHEGINTISQNTTNRSTEIATIIPQKNENYNNCTIMNGNTGYVFYLNRIKSEKIFFENSHFVVNLDGLKKDCDAIFCKDGQKILEKMCPFTVFNYTYHTVNLQYSTLTRCNSEGFYSLEIVLKCNMTRTGVKFLENRECKTIISYNVPEACDLLKQEIISNTPTAAIAGGVTSVFVLVGVILIVYLNRQRIRGRLDYIRFYRDKSNVPIYFRDSRL